MTYEATFVCAVECELCEHVGTERITEMFR